MNPYTIEKISTFETWRQKYNQLSLDFVTLESDLGNISTDWDPNTGTLTLNSGGQAVDTTILDGRYVEPSQIDIAWNGTTGDFTISVDGTLIDTVNIDGRYVQDSQLATSFNSSTGELSLDVDGVSVDLTSLDGRYALDTDALTVDNLTGGAGDYSIPYQAEQATGQFALIASPNNQLATDRGLNAVELQLTHANDELAEGNYSVIAGGANNKNTAPYTVIGGGSANSAEGDYSAITGGQNNRVSGNHSFVGAGLENDVTGLLSSVLGGNNNNILTVVTTSDTFPADYSAILGGDGNNITGAAYAAILGGEGVSVDADYAIAAGYQNAATGLLSVALGSGARANHLGSFVFSDGNEYDRISESWITSSVQDHEFRMSFENGVHIKGNHDDSVAGALTIYGNSSSLTLHDSAGTAREVTAGSNYLYVGNDPLLSGRANRQTETGAFTLSEGSYETGQVFFVNAASAATVSLGAATDGYQAIVIQQGAGTVDFAGSGETVNSKVGSTPELSQQYSAATLIYESGAWFVLGDIV